VLYCNAFNYSQFSDILTCAKLDVFMSAFSYRSDRIVMDQLWKVAACKMNKMSGPGDEMKHFRLWIAVPD
jgi:hypothetical protein